jgi:hypothetical protein
MMARLLVQSDASVHEQAALSLPLQHTRTPANWAARRQAHTFVRPFLFMLSPFIDCAWVFRQQLRSAIITMRAALLQV